MPITTSAALKLSDNARAVWLWLAENGGEIPPVSAPAILELAEGTDITPYEVFLTMDELYRKGYMRDSRLFVWPAAQVTKTLPVRIYKNNGDETA